MSRQTPARIYQAANKDKARIRKPGGIHTLRHAYATGLLEAGVALPVIQRRLGHNSIRSTMRYLHLAQDNTSATRVAMAIGFVCVARIFHAWPRWVVGYACSRCNDAQVAVAVLEAAIVSRRTPRGCIRTTERGARLVRARGCTGAAEASRCARLQPQAANCPRVCRSATGPTNTTSTRGGSTLATGVIHQPPPTP